MLREGDLKWLDELCNVLIDAGIPCSVISDEAVTKAVAAITGN